MDWVVSLPKQTGEFGPKSYTEKDHFLAISEFSVYKTGKECL